MLKKEEDQKPDVSDAKVDCPICSQQVSPNLINSHLDSHLQQPIINSSSQSTLPFQSTSTKRKVSDSGPLTPLISRQSSQKKRTITSSLSSPSFDTVINHNINHNPNEKNNSNNLKPLAERVRPTTLDECIASPDLIGGGVGSKPGLIPTLLQTGTSITFWGGPGTGKTTIARCLAGSNHSFYELSGIDFGTAEWRKLINDHTSRINPWQRSSSSSSSCVIPLKRLLVFIDDAHRLNKTQQDLLLPHIDSGEVMMILSSTENPSFKFTNRLMSRTRLIELKPHSHSNTFSILKRALKLESFKLEEEEDQILSRISSAADGDARVALNQLDLLIQFSKSSGTSIKLNELSEILGKRYVLYDNDGDCHYDMISALHKSVRGSDPDAALYWLARMLEGGEDPLYVARRLVRMASEDIGAGNPEALTQAVSAFQATQLIGMPEADTILAQVVVMLSESPKSVRSYKAYKRAKTLVANSPSYPVPTHLRNAPTKMMEQLGYGVDYKYEPEYAHPIVQEFWPVEIDSNQRQLLVERGSSTGEVGTSKKVDFKLLTQWEEVKNGGVLWDGRCELKRDE
ncbi:hypothetical protein DFH28DRAFT_1034924 [Melampsora americana]|nr:hypothetical protein DFH28DRAFT_1034924 [Melampsora americana]